MAAPSEPIVPTPSVDEFAEVLADEPEWYTLGIMLGASSNDLKKIQMNHGSESNMRCLIEVYDCLKRSMEKSLTWNHIARSLRRMKNNTLADKIHSEFISLYLNKQLVSEQESVNSPTTNNSPININFSAEKENEDSINNVIKAITGEYTSLSQRFTLLTTKVKKSFRTSDVDINELQDLIEGQSGLQPLPKENATIDGIFRRLSQHYSILNFVILIFLVRNLLESDQALQTELDNFTMAVDDFKSSVTMNQLADLIKKRQQTITGDHRIVKLKVREFWIQFTIKQFEVMINEILDTLYDLVSHVSVEKGCICVSWIIPSDIDFSKLISNPKPSEFVEIIGVIYLHIGYEVIYDFSEVKGCETIEAAMLQAIEMKNTRAIELLAMGCSPEVATYNGDYEVTTIVNIRNKTFASGSSSVNYTCILGHNENVEAIVDPHSTSDKDHDQEPLSPTGPESILENAAIEADKGYESGSETNKLKMNSYQERSSCKSPYTSSLKRPADEDKKSAKKLKLLNPIGLTVVYNIETDESFIEIIREIKDKPEIIEITTVIPRHRLGIGAEMKVKVITKDSNGKEIHIKELLLNASLTCTNLEKKCPVIDSEDGTYLVSVTSQQLGQHQLSITANEQHIRGKPFAVDVIPQRNCTMPLKYPIQIDGIDRPRNIAFSDNGDMFVTSDGHHCIYVYGKNGKFKTTIGSELQFDEPYGIDVSGDTIYVIEWGRCRIHKLAIGKAGDIKSLKMSLLWQEFNFGESTRFCDVKISPDGKVYVPDRTNYCVTIYNPTDWTVSHIIDGRQRIGYVFCPESIAFDLSGNVHITGHYELIHGTFIFLVAVFTPSGEFIRHYGQSQTGHPVGIAVDASGYSLVTGWRGHSLTVFDSKGEYVQSSESKLDQPCGVAVSHNGSIWVADTANNRLLQF